MHAKAASLHGTGRLLHSFGTAVVQGQSRGTTGGRGSSIHSSVPSLAAALHFTSPYRSSLLTCAHCFRGRSRSLPPGLLPPGVAMRGWPQLGLEWGFLPHSSDTVSLCWAQRIFEIIR